MAIANQILNLPLPLLNHWGYLLILAAAILEAFPLVGVFIPGYTIVIIGGFFAKMGVLELGDVIWMAALGAIIGDFISYFIGRKFGHPFLLKYGKYFFFKEERYTATSSLIQHHPGKVLIVGRFNPLTRALAPFVAGSAALGFLKFLGYNIIGGVSWAVSSVLIGYIFGKSYEVASRYVGKFIFLAIVLSIILILAYRFINKKRHIFAKYHLYALMLNIASLYIFSKMIEDVVNHESIIRLDVWLSEKVVILQPFFNKIMIAITNIVSPVGLIILSLLLFGVLVYKKRWHNACLLAFGLSGGLLMESLIKLIVHRPRPETALIPVSGYSFPSGHAAMALIFFSLLLYSFKDGIKNRIVKNLFIVTNIILFLLVGFSRIYLNVHWASDVMAGFAMGLFWLTLLILIFKLIISLRKKTP